MMSWKDTRIDPIDPRTKILWMILISSLAISSNSIAALGILILSAVPVWIMAGKLKHIAIDVTKGMIQFILFLAASQMIYQWITLGKLGQGVVEQTIIQIMKVYLMITASVLLFETTGFEEIATAIRTLKIGNKPHGWNQIIESLAFTIGLAFQFVPLLQRKLKKMVEVRRARGIGINEGNPLERAKNYLSMGIPLIVQTLEILKNTFLALLNYSYSPAKKRSQFRRIKFHLIDGIAIAVLAIFTVVFISF